MKNPVLRTQHVATYRDFEEGFYRFSTRGIQYNVNTTAPFDANLYEPEEAKVDMLVQPHIILILIAESRL